MTVTPISQSPCPGLSQNPLAIVGVMGSGVDPWPEFAAPLGVGLAARPAHLLTGGGGGVMAAVARAFVEAARAPKRQGLSLGVLPARSRDAPTETKDGYPNPHVEVAIRTHLPSIDGGTDPHHNRNAINVLTADAVIALPGSAGTRQEVALAMAYRRPLALLGPDGWLAETPTGAQACATVAAALAWLDATLAL